MRKFASIVLVVLFFISCEGPYIFNRVVHLKDGNQMLLGGVDRTAFEKAPFSDWYLEAYEAYSVDQQYVKTIKKNIKNYRVEVFLGTWDEDSRLRYPEFMKILDEVKFPKQRLLTYAVNTSKKSFYSEESGKGIDALPVFIFYQGKKEVGRIVGAATSGSLEEDIVRIVDKAYLNNN